MEGGARRFRPSAIGFGRRQPLPLEWVPLTLPRWALDGLAPLLTLAILVAAWVLRSAEAVASSALALALPAALALASGPPSPVGALQGYLSWYPYGALAASALTLLAVEARRRSYSYEDAGVTIRAGIWRRQEQTIPYASIGRIILEQSLLGRLLGYGTVIIVSPAEWGAEYYTRGVEASIGRGGAAAGVFYARTLKEVSRDPGKCLYGVRRPREVKEAIEAMLRRQRA